MKRDTGILIASAAGLFAAISFLVVRKILNNREYIADYNDYHRHFENPERYDEHHGVEYLSMR